MATTDDNREKWAQALESGNYKQGVGWLAAEGGFCCLGVACEAAIADGVPLDVRGDLEAVRTYDGDTTTLPKTVREWLGVTHANPFIGLSGETAIGYNDERRATFSEIAALIRKGVR